MSILDRYFYRTVLTYSAMVMLVLLTLGALFLFISQQDEIGVGNFSTGDAVLYTLLNLPQQAFEVMPIGAMIGALMGLGNRAANSELVVTRAAGISVWRLAWPVALAGATLSLLMYGIGEYAAPPLARYAQREKAASKMADVSFAGRQSAWIKDGNRILRVETGDMDQAFGGVYVFELAAPNRLASVQRAQRVSIADKGRWLLEDVNASVFAADRIDASVQPRTSMATSINPDFLGLAAADPTLLTLRGLHAYIEHLRRNSLATASYEIGFWSRVARIFAVVIVTLLSLPFVFGPLRQTGAGARTVIGALLGIAFFLATRTIENGGQLFGLDPLIIGWMPTAVISVCTVIAIGRTR